MKIIKQWLCGLIIAIYGAFIILCFVALVVNFICMINMSGWEFVRHFIAFIFDAGLCVIMPYILFWQMQDSIHNRWK